ncbi:shikimate kinase [Galactobacter caseinivorans]|uniref:Shikimate kinase n=1 Tax=Galactobacter caseinivorans TaxID=2676123 RepID=A0A496PL06_9MICC|nr:shikimate kinase [Galactobacter caseinivorans]RKW71196.1 shikimate kinase [Galactobacter caseinivorans]
MTPVNAHVVLVGPMASGKSAVGRELAGLLGLPLSDLDAGIVARHGAITQIFARHGEEHFRALERGELLAALAGEPAVIATGGGVVLDPRNRADLAGSTVVELQIDAATAQRRLGQDSSRPILAGPDPIAAWSAVLADRAQHYSSLATITVDAAAGTAAEVASAIAARLPQNTVTRRTP